MRKASSKLRTILGRVIRDIERKAEAGSTTLTAKMTELLVLAKRLKTQQKKSKDKVYAIQAPEVACIAKGKARNPYEFGAKVSIAVTAKDSWVVGARTFKGNPYDVYGRSLFAKRFFTVLTLQTRMRLQSYIRALLRPSYPLPMMDSADKLHNRTPALFGAPSYSGFVRHGLTCLAITV